jgi:hypothetical protein
MRKWFGRAASSTSGVGSERTAGWGGDDGELEHLENGLGYNHADVEEWVRSQVRPRRAGVPAGTASPRVGGMPRAGASRSSGSRVLSKPSLALVCRGWKVRTNPPELRVRRDMGTDGDRHRGGDHCDADDAVDTLSAGGGIFGGRARKWARAPRGRRFRGCHARFRRGACGKPFAQEVPCLQTS